MGRLKKIIFSRLFLTAVFTIAQILLIAVLALYLASAAIYVYSAFQFLSFILLVWMHQRTDNPSYKLMWTVLILILPVFGVVFYLLWGGRRISRKMQIQLDRVYPQAPLCTHGVDKEEVLRLKRFDPALGRQADYIANVASAPVYVNTDCVFFPSGEAMFERMIMELRKARRFIFLEYFIIAPGVMWDSILEILKEKSQRRRRYQSSV